MRHTLDWDVPTWLALLYCVCGFSYVTVPVTDYLGGESFAFRPLFYPWEIVPLLEKCNYVPPAIYHELSIPYREHHTLLTGTPHCYSQHHAYNSSAVYSWSGMGPK